MEAARELTASYEGFMLTPRPGPGVCPTCFDLIERHERCYGCKHHPNALTRMVPISYSVAHERLHRALAGYKRLDGATARCCAIELGAVLWQFLERHEKCLADEAGTPSFELVTTVPSSDPLRDQQHPLRWIVGEMLVPTRGRFARLLRRSATEVAPRAFSPEKYLAERSLDGESILLIDDTWTTGANAQSAAASLRAAGARAVAAIVIGRHLNRDWGRNDDRLRALPPFDWDVCALCAPG